MALLSSQRKLLPSYCHVCIDQKFEPYVIDNQRSEYSANLIDMSEWVVIQNDAMGCHYSDDDKFLETELIGDADDLISGDNDLLVLQQIGSIPILSVADFLSNFP